MKPDYLEIVRRHFLINGDIFSLVNTKKNEEAVKLWNRDRCDDMCNEVNEQNIFSSTRPRAQDRAVNLVDMVIQLQRNPKMAKKAKKAKKVAKKVAKKTTSSKSNGRSRDEIEPSSRITILKKVNPHREDSIQAKIFDFCGKSKTAGEFVKKFTAAKFGDNDAAIGALRKRVRLGVIRISYNAK